MPSRMDKYNENHDMEITTTRSEKNEQLYKDIYTNRRYTELKSLEKDNIVDITNSLDKKRTSRSDFQRKRMLYEDGFIASKEVIKSNDFNQKIDEKKNISYNVNDILEEAKKNRTDVSEEERKKKILNVEYSILSDLSEEKLKEYRDKKEKPLSKDEEEDLEELIHTITSNSLKKKIDDGLLTDLMPATEEEPVISKEFLESLDLSQISDTVKENEKIDDTKELTLETTLDDSFFTKSMDLKKDDIIEKNDTNVEIDDSYDDTEKIPVWKVILIIALISAVIAILTYIVLRFV